MCDSASEPEQEHGHGICPKIWLVTGAFPLSPAHWAPPQTRGAPEVTASPTGVGKLRQGCFAEAPSVSGQGRNQVGFGFLPSFFSV